MGDATSLTLRFRAKLDTVTDSRGDYANWVERPGYRVPVVKSHHVATPVAEWGTRMRLVLTGSAETMARSIRALFTSAGLCDRYVFDGDPGVTVTPDRGGFMATIVVVLPFNRDALRGERPAPAEPVTPAPLTPEHGPTGTDGHPADADPAGGHVAPPVSGDEGAPSAPGPDVPTYAAAILTGTPTWGDAFTTSDGVRLEWVCDMAEHEWGYCEVEPFVPGDETDAAPFVPGPGTDVEAFVPGDAFNAPEWILGTVRDIRDVEWVTTGTTCDEEGCKRHPTRAVEHHSGWFVYCDEHPIMRPFVPGDGERFAADTGDDSNPCHRCGRVHADEHEVILAVGLLERMRQAQRPLVPGHGVEVAPDSMSRVRVEPCDDGAVYLTVEYGEADNVETSVGCKLHADLWAQLTAFMPGRADAA